MAVKQYFSLALKNLLVNKMRCLQTLLGTVIGVAAVVAVLSVQQGMVNRIDASYNEYSPSLMMMGTYRPVDSSQNFTAEDMAELAAAHPEYITAVSPMFFLTESNIRYNGQNEQDFADFGAMGVNEQLPAISPLLQIEDGRFLQPMDISREQNVCVVTKPVAEAMGGEAVGQTLRIMGQNFQVIGVLAEIKDDQEQFDGAVYIPYTVAQKMQPDMLITMVDGSQCYMAQYYVVANGMDNIASARITVNEALKEVYGENAWHYSASFRYYRQSEQNEVYAMAKKLLAAAALVLLVGGVGIMNVMLAAVQERIKEIAVRKAFGAKRRDIRGQFVIEAASTGVVGGLLGVVVGLAGSCLACKVLELPLRWLNLSALGLPVVIALAVSVCVGVLFGYLPASKAAKQEIAVALRD